MSQSNMSTEANIASAAQAWYGHLEQRRPLLVVLSGPSGVGKDVTIACMKEQGYPCHFVVTTTTRLRRPNETDGVDYNFVSEAVFQEMIARGELLEHATVYGQYKGIPKASVQVALESGLDAIIRVDVQGAARLREVAPQAVTIFLTAESEEALIRRLRQRSTDSEAQLQKRIETARAELLRASEFNYRIVNRENALCETMGQVIAIIQAEKCRMDWQPVSL